MSEHCPTCGHALHLPRKARRIECAECCASRFRPVDCLAGGADMALADRFWSMVDKRDGDGCWEWTGSVKPNGYGQFRANGRTAYAHRVAWELLHGPVPAGAFVCHACDNRRCVRHLFTGTAAENTADMIKKGRDRHPRGETCGTAKLTEYAIAWMKAMRESGMTYRGIAASFGVHPVTAMRAIKGEQWKHMRSDPAPRLSVAAASSVSGGR